MPIRNNSSSCPRLSRASTSFFSAAAKTWMAGTSPAMTTKAGDANLIMLW